MEAQSKNIRKRKSSKKSISSFFSPRKSLSIKRPCVAEQSVSSANGKSLLFKFFSCLHFVCVLTYLFFIFFRRLKTQQQVIISLWWGKFAFILTLKEPLFILTASYETLLGGCFIWFWPRFLGCCWEPPSAGSSTNSSYSIRPYDHPPNSRSLSDLLHAPTWLCGALISSSRHWLLETLPLTYNPFFFYI